MTKTWQPFTQMQDWAEHQQLSIERAEGNYLIDTNGTKYLDGTASLWTNVHGHCHPTLNAAITKQLNKVAHSTLLGLANPVVDQLSEQLVKCTPDGLEHVFYSDSGSTAVEIALKQAFQYWQLTGHPEKTKFVHLDQAYHGDTLGAVSVGGIGIFHSIFGPLLNETFSVPCPNPYRHAASSAEEAMVASLKAFQDILDAHSNQIAALIVEPLVQGAGGMLTHPKGFLSGLETLCRNYKVLLIVDEVATGFGRTGTLFACEQENVSPDLMCLAKGITGGYLPLAATLSTQKIYNAFLAPVHEAKAFFHGHTYTGNALACSAALANLAIFEQENTIAALQPKIESFSQRLHDLSQQPNIGDIRQCGMMVGIELVQETEKAIPFDSKLRIGHQVCMRAREQGIIIRNLDDVLVLMPPLSITLEEIQTLVEVTKLSIAAVMKSNASLATNQDTSA